MHRDNIVSELEIDLDTGLILKVVPRAYDLFPLGGYKSEADLKKWWMRRAVPISQGNMKMTLGILNYDTTQNLLVNNLGLSLTDHYWIRPKGSPLVWSEVNLFTNDFRDVIGEFQFSNQRQLLDLKGKSIFSPTASVQGELRKKWIIGKHNKRYLVKGNYGFSFQQSINERIACLVHEMQGFVEYTPYRLTEVDVQSGTGIGCICECFTSDILEFIPAYDVLSSAKKPNHVSEYEFFIGVCCKNGLSEIYVRNFLEYQILTDFVLTNTDRHMNNFGVLRNTNTLKFVSMAPIFDSGNCLFWDMPVIPSREQLKDIMTNSFRSKERELLKYVTNKNLIDLSKLPDQGQLKEFLCKSNLPWERIEDIIAAYLHKAVMLSHIC
jgi:hypothetical protein